MNILRRFLNNSKVKWYRFLFIINFGKKNGVNSRLTGKIVNNIKGEFEVADNVLIRSFKWNRVELSVAKGATLSIGPNSFVNQGVRIVASDDISIGENVHIGDETVLLASDFHSIDKNKAPKRGKITLEDGVWLATRVIVLKGCTIGKNSVVGAGSVVTKDIPADSFAAGVPAKVLYYFDE